MYTYVGLELNALRPIGQNIGGAGTKTFDTMDFIGDADEEMGLNGLKKPFDKLPPNSFYAESKLFFKAKPEVIGYVLLVPPNNACHACLCASQRTCKAMDV